MCCNYDVLIICLTYKRPYTDGSAKAVNLGTLTKPSWHSSSDLMILPDQPYRKKVPDNLMEAMLGVACKPPSENKSWIEQDLFNNILNVTSTTNAAGNTVYALVSLACVQLLPRTNNAYRAHVLLSLWNPSFFKFKAPR
jgi:hypothetical protein